MFHTTCFPAFSGTSDVLSRALSIRLLMGGWNIFFSVFDWRPSAVITLPKPTDYWGLNIFLCAVEFYHCPYQVFKESFTGVKSGYTLGRSNVVAWFFWMWWLLSGYSGTSFRLILELALFWENPILIIWGNKAKSFKSMKITYFVICCIKFRKTTMDFTDFSKFVEVQIKFNINTQIVNHFKVH